MKHQSTGQKTGRGTRSILKRVQEMDGLCQAIHTNEQRSSASKNKQGRVSSCGAEANVLDCNIVEKEFELQSCY